MTKTQLLLISRKYGTFIALLLIIAIFASTTDGIFLSARNLSNLSRQTVVIGNIAIGMTMVILMGGIDLSVGSLVGLGGIMVAVFTTRLHWHPAVAIAATLLLAGVLPGFINGYISEKYRFHPFVTTLGVMTIARGATLLISPVSMSVGETIKFIGQYNIPKPVTLIILSISFFLYAAITIYAAVHRSRYEKTTVQLSKLIIPVAAAAVFFSLLGWVFLSYRGMPFMVLIFALIVTASHFLLTQTRTGRYMYAIGGNNQAARLSGINVMSTWTFAFILTGVLAAFSGIMLAGRLGGATPTAGNAYELSVIAAVVIGGTSLMGGVGNIMGTLIGIFILGVLTNGMSLWGLSSYVQMCVQGIVIVLAVILDSVTKNIRV